MAALALASVLGVALGFTSASPAAAQRPLVESYTLDNGLPSSHVMDLAQDSEGRLWIVHRTGVSVFDGRRFRSYSNADGLPDHELAALTFGPAGRPWVVSRWAQPRVFHLDGARWHPFPTPPRDPAAQSLIVTSMLVTGTPGAPRVVAGAVNGGLFLWEGGAWSRRRAASSPLPDDQVRDLARVGDRIAVATDTGLCWLGEDALACRRDLPLGRLLALHAGALPDGRPALWVLGTEGLARLVDGELEWTVELDGATAMVDAQYGALVVDPAGGVYFGRVPQAFYLDPVVGQAFPLGMTEGMVTEGANTLLTDREGNVWLGSTRGLNRIESRRFQSWDRQHGLLEDEVTALLEISPGRFVAGHNRGLSLFEDPLRGGSFETLPFAGHKGPPNATRVMDLALAPDGSVWIAAHELGLLRLDPEGRLTRELEANVFTVELDARGVLWTSTGQDLWRRAGGEFERVDSGWDLGFHRWIVATPGGRLHISTRHGLLSSDDGRSWRRAEGPTAASNRLYGVVERRSGEVLVGTGAGLHELVDGALVAWRRGPWRLERPVYAVLEDSASRVWSATDDGVRIWDGEHLVHYTLDHGLAGRETNRGALIADRQGRVWIGTVRGLSVYERRLDLPRTAAPRVELETVEVNGVLQPIAEPLRLDHRQNNLVFHFSPIAFSRREDLRARYRLDGSDADWRGPVRLDATEVRYTHLPPGEYRFWIRVGWIGDDAPWSAAAVSPVIAIVPPLWRRPGVLATLAGLVTLAVWGGVRARLQAVRRRNRTLEALNVQLRDAVAERQALIAELETRNAELERFTYTVSHDLKSPLVTVKGFLGFLERGIDRGDARQMRQDLAQIRVAAERMGRLLEELLELTRVGRVLRTTETFPLEPLVREAVDLLAGNLQDGEVEVAIAPDLPTVTGDRSRLLEVYQNLIENAVKYRRAVAPRIEIGARRNGDETVLYVADNGVGIEPRYHEKVFGLFERLDADADGTGVGLALVKRIVEFHGGRIWVESAGTGRGSTFAFTLEAERLAATDVN